MRTQRKAQREISWILYRMHSPFTGKLSSHPLTCFRTTLISQKYSVLHFPPITSYILKYLNACFVQEEKARTQKWVDWSQAPLVLEGGESEYPMNPNRGVSSPLLFCFPRKPSQGVIQPGNGTQGFSWQPPRESQLHNGKESKTRGHKQRLSRHMAQGEILTFRPQNYCPGPLGLT